MKPKTVIFGIITAFVLVILFNNKEEASFWFFGEIRTSKLLILGVFFVLGVITGGIVFRRKKSHPKEYSINNTTPVDNAEIHPPSPYDNLSDEDRKFLDRD
ncbi:LPXTG cell wall anchor domain-containing protein [Sphingobacterium sp. SGR-19]|uniref:LPXTG cell wall anchor domain-containing protein n=1 Tax=Sphingobacterium sp. SGR-19 TaxID=2710886 RepID=UPI0013ED90B6|nr:LPXTG cell wall anchor domain-containing protein [Sphingobacterium sp. SGR-19]NGM67097.1 LPXTG cell wall anchor domain-containing protein [Sphingobacterium sp. SGR-19]